MAATAKFTVLTFCHIAIYMHTTYAILSYLMKRILLCCRGWDWLSSRSNIVLVRLSLSSQWIHTVHYNEKETFGRQPSRYSNCYFRWATLRRNVYWHGNCGLRPSLEWGKCRCLSKQYTYCLSIVLEVWGKTPLAWNSHVVGTEVN
jgi:hypothetical protein